MEFIKSIEKVTSLQFNAIKVTKENVKEIQSFLMSTFENINYFEKGFLENMFNLWTFERNIISIYIGQYLLIKINKIGKNEKQKINNFDLLCIAPIEYKTKWKKVN